MKPVLVWNDKNVVPPLGKPAIERGNTDGGLSQQLLFKHESCKISTGVALIHDGSTRLWYPGEFGADIHIPENESEQDPIVKWAVCPSAETIVEVIESEGFYD